MKQQIEELLPFYALGTLTDEEHELVERYLTEHPEARQQFEEMANAVSALPYSVTPVQPPKHVKNALMARVTSDERSRSSAQKQTTRRVMRFENFFRAFTLGAAALAIIWVIILNAQVARLQSEISALREALIAQSNSLQQINTQITQLTPSAVMTVTLKGTDVQPQAQGQLIADPNSQSAVLVTTGLSPLEAGRTYQVWLIQGDVAVSAGLLMVDVNGQGVLVLSSEAAIGSFTALGISIEPEGGSPQPTGEIVVLGNL